MLREVSTFTEGDDDTGTFMSTDERKFVVQRPVTEHGMQVGVADTRVDDADERLASLELFLDGCFLDRDGTTLLVKDGDAVLA